MSHRSYQPTQSCSSKLLQQKWDAIYYKEHRRLVKSAKPIVDTSAPAKPLHVIAKWKKQQLEKERAEEIERDNYTLMKKMHKVMTTQTSLDTRRHHSLNDEKRQREMERVACENKAMVQRLQKVKPVYRISDWIDDWQKSEELAQRITTYPTKSPSRSKSAPHGGKRASGGGGGGLAASTPQPMNQVDQKEMETKSVADTRKEGQTEATETTGDTKTG